MEKKFPRIKHLPWSKGITDDDEVISNLTSFWREEVVITEKMDGENTTVTKNKVYARSVDSRDHPSRHWVKAMAATFQWKLDDDTRICGENLYAEHSIHYDNLNSYFYVFGVFKGGKYLSWETVELIANALGLPTVPVLHKGIWTYTISEGEELDGSILGLDLSKSEGYVLRKAGSFPEENFADSIAKFVRKGHVQTEDHWMYQEIKMNCLKK